MRIGLIARADNRGLGIQTWEFARHMDPAKTMVVDCSSRRPLPLHLDRFPGAEVVHGLPTAEQCAQFVQGVDVVFTAETPYNHALFDETRVAGVASVLQYNYEFLDNVRRPHVARPTLFAGPTTWHYDDVPFPNKTLLPVPIAVEHFTPRRSSRATRFLHIVGRPAIHDRNGTADLLAALEHVTAEVTLVLRCQDPRYVQGLISAVPGNVALIVETGDTENYWDNYDADVLVMPRRFGGLCLPAQEALGAGMPVIMPAISPNEWLPSSWLVPATKAGEFMAHNPIDLHSVNRKALADKIDQFAGDPVFYGKARNTARDIAHTLSWASLKPEYEKVFTELAR